MSFTHSMPFARPLEVGIRSDLGELTFDRIYDAHFAFVWRTARRLGVGESDVSDVAQEVFLVVHRRLDSFEHRGAVKTWLYGILRRVVSDYRRTQRRKPSMLGRAEAFEPDAWSSSGKTPDQNAEEREAMMLVQKLLEELDDDKREAFVLAELEQMTTAEIADALDVNPNTVASRIRAGRACFEAALERHELRTEYELAQVEGSAP
ncbi:MAG: RNA polymerase sigma factor [Polyangiaceae bacterium]